MGHFESDLELKENFKTMMHTALSYAQHAHDFLFDETMDNTIALSYLNIAAAKFAAAESLYYSRYEILKRKSAEKIFNYFEIFMSELLANARTNHSQRWTDIEFGRLKDVFVNSTFFSLEK